jgi:hypothetical protein
VANADQANRNGEIIDLPPSIPFDDETNHATVGLGDACNPDIDHDGLTLAQEAAAGTDAALADTDGDRRLDGPEIACGSNPLDAASTPTGADADNDRLSDACETLAGSDPAIYDSDGDRLPDGLEVLRLGTSAVLRDSDSDGCNDASEVATSNGDRVVNSADLGLTAARYGPSTSPTYHMAFDPNRDGVINAIDLQIVASRFGPCAP